MTRLMGPAWGPPGSCRPQMGPMLARWTFLTGIHTLSYFYRWLVHCDFPPRHVYHRAFWTRLPQLAHSWVNLAITWRWILDKAPFVASSKLSYVLPSHPDSADQIRGISPQYPSTVQPHQHIKHWVTRIKSSHGIGGIYALWARGDHVSRTSPALFLYNRWGRAQVRQAFWCG